MTDEGVYWKVYGAVISILTTGFDIYIYLEKYEITEPFDFDRKKGKKKEKKKKKKFFFIFHANV